MLQIYDHQVPARSELLNSSLHLTHCYVRPRECSIMICVENSTGVFEMGCLKISIRGCTQITYSIWGVRINIFLYGKIVQ